MKKLFCVLIGLVFLVDSVPRFVKSVRADRFTAPTPFHSTDKYLSDTAGMREGSSRMIDAFSLLPDKTRPLGIVATDEPVSSFIGMVAAYLSWPREVKFVPFPLTSEAAAWPTNEKQESLSALLLCDVGTPAWARRRMELSRSVVLVPLPAKEQSAP